MDKKNFIELGHCRRPHGIKGAFTLSLFNRDESVLKKGSEVLIFPLSNESQVPVEGLKQKIKSISFGNKTICEFSSVEDRNLAEALIPFSLFYPREDFPKLKDGEFYLNDLLGMKVLSEDGELQGVVESLGTNGVQDILHISGEKELDVLLIDAFVQSIDFEKREIIINVPEHI
ncbi:MAG: ribosome maturation factor RimM [Bacteriovoracaceae bacterium]|nr:ribosome maturation factor RimM [Bacteriovoracaceae bacterium]